MKTKEYNISDYSSGYYQVFAFDMNSSGAINPTNGSKVYTAFYNLKMNFTSSQLQKSKLQLVKGLTLIYSSPESRFKSQLITNWRYPMNILKLTGI